MSRRSETVPSPRAAPLAFGEFRVHFADESLWRGDERIPLRPKTWAVLRLLVERPGRLVTSRELLDAVWPDTAVTPSVLTNVIGELRAALDDRTGPARFVQTVHRRGYRFVAELRAAVSAGSLAAPRPAAPGPEQPIFVGRDAELDALHAEWRRVRQGERRLVFVAGVPGIGKSTLVDAFLARIVAAAPGASVPAVARAQCIERQGTSEPYLPLLDAFEQLATGARRSALGAALRRHAPAWLAHLPWLASDDELLALQRSLPGSGEARMAREGSRLLEALAARRPLVVILEDLHWSDAPTLSVLAALAGRSAPAHLLVLGTYRPIDAVVEGHPIVPLVRGLRQRGHATELPLAPFAIDELRACLERRFSSRDLAARLAPQLEEQSGGNPLFVRALLAHMVAHGVIARRGDAWELRTDADDVGLPGDLREAIDRQWADVPARTRAVLDAAAVDGVEFAVDAVAAALDTTEDEVEDVCHGLSGAGRLLPVGDAGTRRGAARVVRYRFPHALHRRVLYDRLPPSRRRDLHRRIGDHLERSSPGGDAAARLVVHFEAIGDEVRTARWVEQVGWNAMARHAYGVAARSFTSAIGHLQHASGGDGTRAHEALLQLVLGNAHVMTHGYAHPLVHDAFVAAERIARPAGLHDVRFRALLGLSTVAFGAGDPLRAAPYVEQMVAMAAAESPQFAAQALWRSGNVHLQQGDFAMARAAFARAAATEPAPGVPFGTDLQADLHGLLGLTLTQLGLLDQARAAFERALRRADEVDLPFSYGQARALAAEGCLLRGDAERILTLVDEAVVWMERYAFPSAPMLEGFYRSWALHRREPRPVHVRAMHDALRGKHAIGEHWHDSVHLAAVAAAYLDCGDPGAARACLAAARAHVAATGERSHEAELHRLDGELKLAEAGASRACAEADAAFARAVDVARAQGALLWELRAATSRARAARTRRGAARPLRDRLARVLGRFREGTDSADVHAARAVLADLG